MHLLSSHVMVSTASSVPESVLFLLVRGLLFKLPMQWQTHNQANKFQHLIDVSLFDYTSGYVALQHSAELASWQCEMGWF